MQHDAVDEREDRRVHADAESKRQDRDCRETGRFEQLTGGEFEILNHRSLAFG